MGTTISAQKWKQLIEKIEIHDQGLADTLAIMVDPKLRKLLEESKKDIKRGRLIPLGEA